MRTPTDLMATAIRGEQILDTASGSNMAPQRVLQMRCRNELIRFYLTLLAVTGTLGFTAVAMYGERTHDKNADRALNAYSSPPPAVARTSVQNLETENK
ncbi:MAG: hypothetical protein AAGG38_14800 [Planctomycetota bacterium]